MHFCSNCLTPISKKDLNTISVIAKEYQRDNTPWYIGYSGGKDSSALLILVFNALLEAKSLHKKITVIYCDTGVEIPTISGYVKSTIHALTQETKLHNLPIEFVVAAPKLQDRFFVKVIGRGYPTPTNIFRWCTNKLRINPVKTVISKTENSVVLLGVRNGESKERDKTIKKHSTESKYYLNQGTSTTTKIFSPIINYSLKDVWATLKYNSFPSSIDYNLIGKLYKDAGSECPVYKESKGAPCGKGRFGCWTCTVVRQDKSVTSMVQNGHNDMEALLEFRNWLAKFRDNKRYRCVYRRNGTYGLGPITLKGRKLILEKLLETERISGHKLIQNTEIEEIRRLWKLDKNSTNYRER